MNEGVPSREVLWNIENSWIMYPLFLLALAVAVYFFYRRYRLWKIGQPENRSNKRSTRLKGAFFKAVLQSTVIKEKGPGFMHVAMYVGFGILVIATVAVFLQADFGIPIVYGDFYLYFLSLTVDIAGLMFVVAMVALIIRRLVRKDIESKPADYLILFLLLIIGLGGFMLEGLRIEGTNDPWALWSPIGYITSFLFAGMTDSQIHLTHQIIWWSHMALAFGLIAYWTWSKLVHVFLIPGSIYWRSLEPKGVLPFIDFEDEDLETMGVGKLEEFTWKDLYDTQACVRCGRCENNCPAHLSGKSLSPMKVMQDLETHLEQRGPIIREQRKLAKASINSSEDKHAAQNSNVGFDIADVSVSEDQQAILDLKLVEDVVASDALWACTTCAACMEQCPALLEHVPKIVKMRTYEVSMESEFPPEAQATFRNMETNGNPWGLGWQTRTKWASDLKVPTLSENPTAEYLYWPGCSGAFDSRNRKVSVAIVQLLQKAGVDFAILGNEEKCCGETARRMGNEYLYSMLAGENIATLNQYGVKKIITQCPHCLNSLRVDYPQMGGNYEVVHHTELLHDLVSQGKIRFDSGINECITYHDSCYLGRYQNIYDQPRKLLRLAGAEVVEMERTGDKSFCCGAGGGRMWLEEHEGKRINEMRTEQALATPASLISTACPYCLSMFADGIASKESTIKVKDIAEIMAEAQGSEKIIDDRV